MPKQKGNEVKSSETKQSNEVKSTYTKSMTLQLNPWLICGLMALVIVLMLLLWRPWSTSLSADSRTVTVNGSATVEAEPDKYVFSPSYEFENADRAAGLAALTAKSDEIVAGLKNAGVADEDIKTDASGYRNYYFYDQERGVHSYTLQITATTRSRDQAQKTQDYLLTTSPEGAVTPQVTFSESTRKKLEAEGRDRATKDARAQAEQQANNLGFGLGKVKSVSDASSGQGVVTPYFGRDLNVSTPSTGEADTELSVQPGQNELHYQVEVTYFIK